MINEILYWSLYTASAKKIAKRTGHPIQAVLRDAMLIWQKFDILPHQGLSLYWMGCQGKEGFLMSGTERVLH